MDAADGHAEPTRTQMQDRIEQLEDQLSIDEELISALVADGVVDQAKIANLETALVTCRRIGAAMGILMASRKLPEDRAFELLRTASQNSHRKLRDIADDVMRTGTLDP